jgi:hypothetical protein
MKGSAFTARFAFLRERHRARWDEYVNVLEPETQALAKGPCLEGSWYDFACFVDLNLKAERLFGDGRLSIVREMVRNAAVVNLPALYKLFYKIGSPDYVLAKSASLWGQHHDSGRAEGRLSAPTTAEYKLFEFGAPHVTLCRSLEGFLIGALETMGMRNVAVNERRCRLRGDDCCAYEGIWSDRHPPRAPTRLSRRSFRRRLQSPPLHRRGRRRARAGQGHARPRHPPRQESQSPPTPSRDVLRRAVSRAHPSFAHPDPERDPLRPPQRAPPHGDARHAFHLRPILLRPLVRRLGDAPSHRRALGARACTGEAANGGADTLDAHDRLAAMGATAPRRRSRLE